MVRVSSRRGTVEAVKARVTDRVRPGLLFMGYSFPDQVPTNVLTINAIDPLSGTAELKACAVKHREGVSEPSRARHDPFVGNHAALVRAQRRTVDCMHGSAI